ncbi:hypothetical protein P4654_02035 [Niallia taxi]|uniref:hypothetical protein n=1 Tax=Niallia taxi TaxID=2499688 RepID=UPI002E23A9CE|nr:hypothetical protein [Niallia taxi]MED4118079.1 hypothetical protein [Niallia taxi]
MPSLKSSLGNRNAVSLDDVCILISTLKTQDELGQDDLTEFPRQIFCSKLSVNRAEFLAAGQLNFKPEMTIIIDSDEYEGEKSLRYEEDGLLTDKSPKYRIYRDYRRPDGFTELYCEVRTGG